MGKGRVVRIQDEAYLMALREVEEGRERSLYDLVSKAIKFYLNTKELMNPLLEEHSEENTAKKRPRKRGLPVPVCASSRKSLSAESWASLLRVLNFEPAPRGSRRQVPAYIKVEDGSLLERFGKNLKELEEEAKRIVVKHPARFNNVQLGKKNICVVERPDGSREVVELGASWV